MEPHSSTSKAEAERLLGIAEKLLRNRDFNSARDFALLAQETEPLLDGTEQILAVVDVLLASEKRLQPIIPSPNAQYDWYAILLMPSRTDDFDLIKKQYRRLTLLLHPDKNKCAFSDAAFRLVADAWGVLSDPGKKARYDSELTLYKRVDLVPTKRSANYAQTAHQQRPTTVRQPQPHQPQVIDFSQQQKLPVRRTGPRANAAGGSSGSKTSTNNNTNLNFWTVCPYCYNLFEYPKAYIGCCLRCQKCRRGFSAVEVKTMPPRVPGQEAYYCVWTVFPMCFVQKGVDLYGAADVTGPPEWVAPAAPVSEVPAAEGAGNVDVNVNVSVTPAAAAPKRKRGRPRKIV